MNKKVKFSVLMSVYKNDKVEYVKIAIESILNQTLKPNQFVIMIDGPVSENMHSLLDNYAKNDKIIELHYRDENLGLGKTLNEGINYCKYEYVARMDADDYSCPNRFEEQIKYLTEHSDISIIGSNIEEFSNDINIVESLRIVPETNEEILEFIKKRNPFNHPSVVFKKVDVISSGNYKDVRYMQDYFLWVDLISNEFKGYNIQTPLVKMRADNNLFKRRSGKEYIKIQNNLFKYMRQKGMINFFEYINSMLIRIGTGLMPNSIRKYVFKKVLREDVK